MTAGGVLELVDAGLRDASTLEHWVADPCFVELEGSYNDVATVSALVAERAPREVVAVGGGTLLDAVKVTRALRCGRLSIAVLDAPPRRSLVMVREQVDGWRLRAVASTFGTGAEASAVAVAATRTARRRLMLAGPVIAPDEGVSAPGLIAGLPPELVGAGLREVLYRLTGPLTTSNTPWSAFELELLARLDAQARGEARLGAIAAASPRLHAPALRSVRDPFAYRGWYLAHELACAAGVTKIVATDWLLPRLLALHRASPQLAVLTESVAAREVERRLADLGWSGAGPGERLAAFAAALSPAPPAIGPWRPTRATLIDAIDATAQRWPTMHWTLAPVSASDLADALRSPGLLGVDRCSI
ncbi:MAG: iron-containing alcohol dehydrogenase [Patulibacter sp.]